MEECLFDISLGNQSANRVSQARRRAAASGVARFCFVPVIVLASFTAIWAPVTSLAATLTGSWLVGEMGPGRVSNNLFEC